MLLLVRCRAFDPARLVSPPDSLPLRLPALAPQVCLRDLRLRTDLAAVVRDIRQLFDRELREVLTNPADSTQVALNVRRVRYGEEQGFAAVSGFSFCSLNLLGLPRACYALVAKFGVWQPFVPTPVM